MAAALVVNLAGAFRVHRITIVDRRGNRRRASEAALSAGEIHAVSIPDERDVSDSRFAARQSADGRARRAGQKLYSSTNEFPINNAQSCADCHSPEKAFTDGRRTARGAEGEFGPRNTMPLFNLAWKKEFFWDGRAKSLREQVLQPIQNPIEMHQPLTNLCEQSCARRRKTDYRRAVHRRVRLAGNHGGKNLARAGKLPAHAHVVQRQVRPRAARRGKIHGAGGARV